MNDLPPPDDDFGIDWLHYGAVVVLSLFLIGALYVAVLVAVTQLVLR